MFINCSLSKKPSMRISFPAPPYDINLWSKTVTPPLVASVKKFSALKWMFSIRQHWRPSTATDVEVFSYVKSLFAKKSRLLLYSMFVANTLRPSLWYSVTSCFTAGTLHSKPDSPRWCVAVYGWQQISSSLVSCTIVDIGFLPDCGLVRTYSSSALRFTHNCTILLLMPSWRAMAEIDMPVSWRSITIGLLVIVSALFACVRGTRPRPRDVIVPP